MAQSAVPELSKGVDSESIAPTCAGSIPGGTAAQADKSSKKGFTHKDIQNLLGKAEAEYHGLLLHVESLQQEVTQLRAGKAHIANKERRETGQ